ALGDAADSPRFIETVPKRGYRFIAPIEVVARPAAGQPVAAAVAAAPAPAAEPERPEPAPSSVVTVSAGSRAVLLAAVGALAVSMAVAALYLRIGRAPAPPSKMTLAVLPFENLSAEADQDFFTDGFTDEMIAELGKLD